MLESCPRSIGPSLWRDCAQRQIEALAPAVPPIIEEAPSTIATPSDDASSPSLAHLPRYSGVPTSMPDQKSGPDLQAKEVYLAVAPSVYVVVAAPSLEAIQEARSVSQGSAVAVSNSLALTNCHVIGTNQLVVMFDGDKALLASVWAGDGNSDRCILESHQPLRPISGVCASSTLEVGETVYSIGNPAGLQASLAQGIISGIRSNDDITLVQTTASISGGSSGGALVDSRGNLVGITTFLAARRPEPELCDCCRRILEWTKSIFPTWAGLLQLARWVSRGWLTTRLDTSCWRRSELSRQLVQTIL